MDEVLVYSGGWSTGAIYEGDDDVGGNEADQMQFAWGFVFVFVRIFQSI